MKKVPPPITPSPGDSSLPSQVVLVSSLSVRLEASAACVLVTVEGNTRVGDPVAASPIALSLPAALRLARLIDETTDDYLYHDEEDSES